MLILRICLSTYHWWGVVIECGPCHGWGRQQSLNTGAQVQSRPVHVTFFGTESGTV